MTGLPGDARERLAAALAPYVRPNEWADQVADALLPVVAELADLRAADELRAAAADYWADVRFPIARYPEVRDWLRTRAAALTPTAEGDPQ